MWMPLWISVLLQLGGPAELPRGQIVNSVACLQQPEQRYALFLPSAYSTSKKWPIVLMLDPAAQGRVPLEAFAAAAEDLGFILVGSNNSQNGPLEPTVAALTALWSEVAQRYSIDPGRVYLAGFSGGARMASQLAQATRVAGVIACGAGLLSGDAAKFPFAFIATAGNRDMNALEVRTLVSRLEDRGTVAALIEFDGGHQWPPPAAARRVLKWLKLQAMRRRLEPVDEAFVERYRQDQLREARRLEEDGRWLDAYQRYRDLADDLEGLADTSAARGRAGQLRHHRGVQEEQRRQQQTDALESREIKTLMKQFTRPLPNKSDAWWRKKLDYYSSLEERKLRGAADLSQRLLQFVLGYAGEKAWMAAAGGDLDAALALNHIALLARPDSAELLYREARYLALAGRDREALETLRKAFKLGWDDGQRLRQDEAFERLRGRPEFKQLTGPR